MTEPIRGKVARVLSTREIALNIGTAEGVTVGMHFDVMGVREDITDPDTGEKLGSLERPKVRVRVIYTQEKFSVASTYQMNLGPVARSLMPPNWVTKYETLKKTAGTIDNLDAENGPIKVGEPVVQVIETNRVNRKKRLPVSDTSRRDSTMPFSVRRFARSRHR